MDENLREEIDLYLPHSFCETSLLTMVAVEMSLEASSLVIVAILRYMIPEYELYFRLSCPSKTFPCHKE
jgi:hypothetical protein